MRPTRRRVLLDSGSSPAGASHLASVQSASAPQPLVTSTPNGKTMGAPGDMERSAHRTHSCDSLPSALGSQMDVNFVGSPVAGIHP